MLPKRILTTMSYVLFISYNMSYLVLFLHRLSCIKELLYNIYMYINVWFIERINCIFILIIVEFKLIIDDKFHGEADFV